MDTSKVTRFEVIGKPGRMIVRYGVSVRLALQDEGRTLKVFLGDSPIATPGEVQKEIQEGLEREVPLPDIMNKILRGEEVPDYSEVLGELRRNK